MIAIGGAIGTGLVIGSGTSLARSGPGSLFLAYLIMGIVSRARTPTRAGTQSRVP
jgi:amino acid transporter